MRCVLRSRSSLIATAVGLAFSAGVQAQIATDGTLGAATALTGPNYAIGASLGRQIGSNLFHSFSAFNLASGESASFSGPAGIANVISRVTGGSASNIDGLIRSTITGANLFLINPKGILFGPNASLDLTGSFHASTADYLKLGDGGRFDATDPSASVLTSAPPEAFGFLGGPPALLSIEGSRLDGAEGKSLSIVGGHVSTNFDARISARGGDIQLIAVTSAGEVPVNPGAGTGTATQLGDMSLGSTQVSTESGAGLAPGRILIRGGRLSLFASAIASTNTAAAPAGSIRIEAADYLDASPGTTITSTAEGSGRGAPIDIVAASTIFWADTTARTVTTGTGAGGDITITTPSYFSMTSFDGASIASLSAGAGRGGSILLDAGTVEMINGAGLVTSRVDGAGGGGAITIRAGSLQMADRARIETVAATGSSGAPGAISLEATTTLELRGDGSPFNPTRIDSLAHGSAAGADIRVTTPLLSLDGGVIRTAAAGPAAAGQIIVSAADVVTSNGGRIEEGVRGRVILDGTLGTSGALTGPDYAITADLGQMLGVNLFHSFLSFDLLAGESATFSGPGSIAHIIARVTGDERSIVDGTMRTTIPGAGLYFVNARGLLFGPNARLDLSGSFHASSADYVRLGEDGRFDARDPAASVVSASAPSAFGFGDMPLGTVSLSGARLEGRDAQSISLVGAEVSLTDHSAVRTFGGDIRLVSLASSGEVPLSADSQPSAGASMGSMTLRDSMLTADSTAGLAPGRILVRGGEFDIFSTPITSTNTEAVAAGDIMLRASGGISPYSSRIASIASGDGRGANISLESDQSVSVSSPIESRSEGTGRGGDIAVTAPSVDVFDTVESSATGSGRGGDISIRGDSLYLYYPVRTSAFASGRGGDIGIVATGSVSVYDDLAASTAGSGDGGNIGVSAPAISNGGTIRSEAADVGRGGTVRLIASEVLSVDGQVSAETSGGGAGGALVLSAPSIELAGGAVRSRTAGAGSGGDAMLAATSVVLSDGASIETVSAGPGQSGAIVVDVGSLSLGAASTISTRAEDTGGSGVLSIRAETVNLASRSRIESVAVPGSVGSSGPIGVEASTSVTVTGDDPQVNPTQIHSHAQGSAAGADITLTTPLLTLDGGAIRTAATGGASAGHIVLNATEVVTSNDGRIEENAQGRVVLDGTLGPAGTLTGPDFTITADLGRILGLNLFHSFLRFDLLTGESATFSGPIDIAHIIARVTGDERSLIDGTVRTTIPGAALYFINPHGLLFGPNARLDLAGSFHAGSADRVRLGNDGRLDARDPSSSVLTASAPVALGLNAAPLGSVALVGAQIEGREAQSISLIGGNVSITEAAAVRTLGGEIRLVSLGASGEVPLTGDSLPTPGASMGSVSVNDSALTADSASGLAPGRIVVRGADVSLTDSTVSSTNSEAVDAGTISITATQTLRANVVSQASGAGRGASVTLDAATIESTAVRAETTGTGAGGDITISATEQALVRFASTPTDGFGPGGNVLIRAPVLEIEGYSNSSSLGLGPQPAGSFTAEAYRLTVTGGISTETLGAGAAGAIRLTATDRIDLLDAQISSFTGNIGRGGDILIEAPRVNLDGGFGYVTASTGSFGPSGNIDIRGARIAIANGFRVLTESDGLGTGQAGNITVQAAESIAVSRDPEVFSFNFTTISSSVRGDGRAGDILLSAPLVQIQGESVVRSEASVFGSGGGREGGTVRLRGDRIEVSGSVTTSSFDGRGGDIDIRGGSLRVSETLDSDGNVSAGELSASAEGRGSAGSVVIDMTDSVKIDAPVSASARDESTGGTISVSAPEISIGGSGGLTSFTAGSGDGGRIAIDARTLMLDGGRVDASTSSAGAGGSIAVKASDVGMTNNAAMVAETSGSGRGGTVTITSERVLIDAGAQVGSSASAAGAAGAVSIVATEHIKIGISAPTPAWLDAGVRADTSAAGNGGNIDLRAPLIEVEKFGSVRADSFGSGPGGNIRIEAQQLRVGGGGSVSASTDADGDAGRIDIVGRDLTVEQKEGFRGNISSDAYAAGSAGGISINLSGAARIDGNISALTLDGPGRAGNVDLTADSIELRNGVISATTYGSGDAGRIMLKARRIEIQSVDATGTGVSSKTAGSGNAGAIVLNADRLVLVDGGSISTVAFANSSGAAGAITVNATSSVDITGRDHLGYPSQIESAGLGDGPGGTISIAAPSIRIDEGVILAQSLGAGDAGAVSLRADQVTLLRGGRIDAGAEGQGAGGSIDVRAASSIVIDGREAPGPFGEYVSRGDPSGLSSVTRGSGPGGNIAASASRIDIGAGGRISASSTGTGIAGAIDIAALDALHLTGSSIATEAISSDGGNIGIKAGNRVYLKDSEITTSVGSGQGSGGNIVIDPIFVILENSRVVANAFGGAGGNITIVAQYFLASPDSIVEASSQLGVSGSVQISAPQTDVLSGLPALSAEFFDASGLLREACGGRWQPGSSRLVGVGHGGVALPTSGYVASRYFDDAATPHPDVGGVSSPTRSAESQPPVLLAGICAR